MKILLVLKRFISWCKGIKNLPEFMKHSNEFHEFIDSLPEFSQFIKMSRDYPYWDSCLKGIASGWFPVFIKYPVNPQSRYGYGLEPHFRLYSILNKERKSYEELMHVFMQFKQYFLAINVNETSDFHVPFWSNPWFTGLDAISLYAFITIKKPKTYLEIGSGNSTKFARQAINDHLLETKIVSIDPFPRTEIDSISDFVIRKPLEEIDLSVFNILEPGDILFFDGSHRCFMNSDVTVFFLEVLPMIPSGVLIHIHDIHLPLDYPPARKFHWESEQYLLATMLLANDIKYRTILPNKFVMTDEELLNIIHPLLTSLDVADDIHGFSFWMEKTIVD